ncbi:MAG: hypothetical protein ACOYWZ_02160 [Bacillota bacterium]
MIQNSRLLNAKDTESPQETIISGVNLTNSIASTNLKLPAATVTKQQEINDNFDTFIEKRK